MLAGYLCVCCSPPLEQLALFIGGGVKIEMWHAICHASALGPKIAGERVFLLHFFHYYKVKLLPEVKKPEKLQPTILLSGHGFSLDAWLGGQQKLLFKFSFSSDRDRAGRKAN